ncbi:class I SAM-dependent methyltransferase ['Paenibacillus yunnanensis' Narsing Rao et al. 2020]|uniref:class I SAM-dependent methyltransferase n=1 Tax=Paenibacillus tengchongensis TaxID=2608684 RepID=UPI00124D7859|nr:class I SAM-dependent methyltransferase [Paenibacillus tengchongensis]
MNRDYDNQIYYKKHWYAEIYEQQENQTDDVEFILKAFGGQRLKVLEVCCGGGRIAVPLAEAGHQVTGFDADEEMLKRLCARAKTLDNLACYQADAVQADWGSGFEAVILAGNIMINIETEMDYREAQRLFLRKAAACLVPGGMLLLDFNLFADPVSAFTRRGERVQFEGTDSLGTYGRLTGLDSVYDPDSQVVSGRSRTEMQFINGERYEAERSWSKHIPTLVQVEGWLEDAGFKVLTVYGDYADNPVSNGTYRAVILARRGQAEA